MLKKFLSLCTIGVLGLVASSARATQVGTVDTITLNQSGCCGTGPFGTVTLTQGSGFISVAETLNSGIAFVGTGAGDSFAFNLAGLTTSDVTFTGSSVGEYTFAVASSKNSPYGNFSDAVDCINCGPGASKTYPGPLDFTITLAGIDLSQFTTTGGVLVASDIIDRNIDGTPTGVVGGGSPTVTTPGPVPEPSSLLLLGTGIVGAAGFLRRRFVSQLS